MGGYGALGWALRQPERFARVFGGDPVEGSSVPLTSSFGPGGHDWAYWDATIRDVLAWLPLRTAG